MYNSPFKEPVWYRLGLDKILALSDAEIEELKVKQAAIDEHNKIKLKEIQDDLKTIKDLTKKIYGEHSKEYKYTKKFVKSIPYSNDFKFYILDVREKDKQEKARIAREKEAEIAQNKYLTECISYLINKGKNIGRDFTAENAIVVAEDIAERKAINDKTENGDEFFDFSGQNCDGPCAGWDGISHRCECGNRRVDWVRGDGFSIHDPYIYGEAY